MFAAMVLWWRVKTWRASKFWRLVVRVGWAGTYQWIEGLTDGGKNACGRTHHQGLDRCVDAEIEEVRSTGSHLSQLG